MAEEKSDNAGATTAKKYPLAWIRDFPFPGQILDPSDVESVMDFKPLDTDIFVVTYPKCGTTWAQFIVWEILHKGAVPPSPNKMMFRDFPFLEFTGVKMLEQMPPPRTMKTHLPFHLQPYNPKAKYIYIARNPWDCCVSYYYHLNGTPNLPQLTFDEYFDLFVTGELGWGDFFDHVLSWFKHRNDPNVLFLTYEYMKKENKKTVLGIAKFLGDSYFEDVSDEEVLENCIKHSDFKYMKELGMFFPKVTDENISKVKEVLLEFNEVDRTNVDPKMFTEVNFFRKGQVGDWKNHFSSSHIRKFNEYMIRKLTGTEMEDFWKPLMEETSL